MQLNGDLIAGVAALITAIISWKLGTQKNGDSNIQTSTELLKELRSVNSELVNYRSKSANLELQVITLTNSNRDFQKQVNDLTLENQSLRQEVDKLRKAVENLTATINRRDTHEV